MRLSLWHFCCRIYLNVLIFYHLWALYSRFACWHIKPDIIFSQNAVLILYLPLLDLYYDFYEHLIDSYGYDYKYVMSIVANGHE